MPLDLSLLHPQLRELGEHLAANRGEFAARLNTALTVAERSSQDDRSGALRERIADHPGRYTWLVGDPVDPINTRESPTAPPFNRVVLAVDGSQIEVERDAPVACYLLNIGEVSLRYGETPGARLRSIPTLQFGSEQLTIADPKRKTREQVVDGVTLGALRATAELEALVSVAEELPEDMPAVGLIDGTLVQWGFSGQGYPSFLRDRLLGGYLRALDRLQALASHRPFAIASYISLPRATETVNALRLAVCPYPTPDCDKNCGSLDPSNRPCDTVARVRDRDLFGSILEPGDRSGRFDSKSSVVVEDYGPHAVSFYYINAGSEVGRFELPEWSVPRLDLVHSVVWSQVVLGQGYPVALAEAHEQAVVRVADRDLFWELVDAASGVGSNLPRRSEKNVAKRRRPI
jgi:hypothetical protein